MSIRDEAAGAVVVMMDRYAHSSHGSSQPGGEEEAEEEEEEEEEEANGDRNTDAPSTSPNINKSRFGRVREHYSTFINGKLTAFM